MATVLSPSDQIARGVGKETKVACNAFQQTIATGSIGGMIADRAMILRGLRVRVGVCGTAGSTVVQIHKNGSAVASAEVTIAHDDTDGTVRQAGVSVAIAKDDAIEIVVSTAPTAGTDLAVDCLLVESYT